MGWRDECVLPLMAPINLFPARGAAVAGSLSSPPTEAPRCTMSACLCLALSFLLVLRKSGLPLTPACAVSCPSPCPTSKTTCMLLDCVSSFRGQAIPGPAMPTRCCLHQVLCQHPGNAEMAVIFAVFRDVRAGLAQAFRWSARFVSFGACWYLAFSVRKDFPG